MARIDEALATFLVNSTWQVALVACLTSVLIRPVRSSAARHGLWAFSLMLGLMLPIASVLPRHQPDPLPEMGAGARAHVGELASPIEPTAKPGPGVESRDTRPESTTLHLPPGLSFVLASAYMLFVASRLVLAWRAWRAVRRIRNTATRMAFSDECGRVVERCREAFGLTPITITSSSRVRVPVAIGARSPVIALPDGLFAHLSMEELAAIVGHEMAHIRRRDIAMNFLYELFYLPVSFHPAAAFMKRRVATSREQACDDLVIDRLMSRPVYARSLVSIAARVSGAQEVSYGVAVGDERSLESRIHRLLAPVPGSRGRSLAWAAAAAGVLSIGSWVGDAAAFRIAPSGAPMQQAAIARERDSRQPTFRSETEARRSSVFRPVDVGVAERATWEERSTSARPARSATSVERPAGWSGGPGGSRGPGGQRPEVAARESDGELNGVFESFPPSSASLMRLPESAPVRESAVSSESGETSHSLLAAAQASETWESVVREHPVPAPRQGFARPSRHEVAVFKTKKRFVTWLMVGVGGGVLSQLDYEREGRLRWERHAGW